jgi:hypothetical protein
MLDTQNSLVKILKPIYPFSDLDDANLNLMLPVVEHCQYSAGSHIFESGDESDAIYFIVSGSVNLFLPQKGIPQKLLGFNAYDHFGEDAILKKKRQTMAVAVTEVFLIKISAENIKQVSRQSSMILRIFHLFALTYQNYCQAHLKWHQPSETFYLLLHRHAFFLWSKLIPIILLAVGIFSGLFYLAFTTSHYSIIWIVLAILALGLGGLFSVWEILAWSNEYVSLTKDRIVNQKLLIGLFESRRETPMNAILSVGLATSFTGRLIGYGAVTARAYTGNFEINQIPDPDLVYSYLEYRRKCILLDQRRQEKASMQALLERKIHPKQFSGQIQQPGDEKPAQINYYSDSFSDLLARFFSLRIEQDGVIIYHTHWWVLLKMLFLPNVLLLIVVVTTLTRFFGLFAVNAVLIYSLALVGAVIGWGWWFYQFIDWRNDVYIIAADQLVDINRHPLGSEDKNSAPIKNIQTVDYKRNGIIGMALNFGTVRIQIGNEELTFDDVYNPSAVQMEIFSHFREFTKNSLKMDQGRMTEWFSTYDGIRGEEENQGPKPSGNE